MKNFKIAIFTIIIFISCAPSRQIDSFMNSTNNPPAYEISEKTIELHRNLTIVDLHSDALMWERDLLKRNDRGHVDFPRLVEGNVSIQAFTIVSILPAMMNNNCNLSSPDTYCCLSIMQGWPASSWFSFRGRADYQIKKLHDAEMKSAGKFTIITTKTDLDNYLERRKKDKSITAGFIGLEGAYPLDGIAENISAMFDAGVRMIGMTHFTDSDMSGSVHGYDKGGLSPEGIKLIGIINKKGIIIDLSHASRETIKEILAISAKPVIFSHTGVKGICDNNRNITDEEIKGIAKNGGVIGVGFFRKATCGNDVSSIADSIDYVVKLAGIDYAALGSDFDGGVSAPLDSSRLIYLTDELVKRGYSQKDIAKIMGENAIRVMREVLP